MKLDSATIPEKGTRIMSASAVSSLENDNVLIIGLSGVFTRHSRPSGLNTGLPAVLPAAEERSSKNTIINT